eukprot:gene6305-6540_t
MEVEELVPYLEEQLTGLGSLPLHVEADSGTHGGKQWMEGRRGADKVVPVPVGTLVWRLLEMKGSSRSEVAHGVTALPRPPAVRSSSPARPSHEHTDDADQSKAAVDNRDGGGQAAGDDGTNMWPGSALSSSAADHSDDDAVDDVEEGNNVWSGEVSQGVGGIVQGVPEPPHQRRGWEGDDDEKMERHFTKQQVWSILEAQAELLAELDQEGQQVGVAVGGQGGRGNAVSSSKPHGPASRTRSDGAEGQEVGSYAFTTLRPQLGAITGAAWSDELDIKGHRARCLALVVDLTGSGNSLGSLGVDELDAKQEASEGDDTVTAAAAAVEPGQAFSTGQAQALSNDWNPAVAYPAEEQLMILKEELQHFDARALHLPLVVVANKVDLLSPAGAADALKRLKEATNLPIVPVSAKQKLGLSRLQHVLQLLVTPR